MPSRRGVSWAKFRVFMVAVCGLSILGVLVYLLTGGTLLARKTSLYLYIPDATGVTPGSPVRVDGINVGKVRSVKLSGLTDPNRIVQVAMTVEIKNLRSIPLDSYAQISADTLIGDKFVDISSGRLRASMPLNGEVRYQPQTDIMKNLDLTQFERQLRIVDALLTDIEQGKGPVGEFVQKEALYSDTRQKLIDLERGLTAAARATGQVGQVLYTDALYKRISEPVHRLDDTLARMQSGQGAAGRLLRDPADYDRLRAQAADLRNTLARIGAGSGPIGELVVSDAAYRDLVQKAASMIGAVDRFNTTPALTTSEMYDSLNGVAREMRDFFRDFRESPKKYLRLKLF